MANKAKIDKPVPDMEVEATGKGKFKLSELKGKYVVLYFYPRDDTPGCTTEGKDFRDQYRKLQSLKAAVFGVSRDSLESHKKFRSKYKFPFALISDEDEKLCKAFGVIKEKSLYGKKYLGIDRSTFIIDKKGILRREFRGVKVANHVNEVLASLRELQK